MASLENSKEHWDYIWANRGIRTGPGEGFMKAVSHLIGGKVLDIGCGKTVFREKMTVIFEKDYETLDISSTSNPTYVHDITLNNKLPVEDNCYDTIIASHILEHLDKETEEWLLKEISRILKPGGFCLIELPHGGELGEHMVVLKDVDVVRDMCKTGGMYITFCALLGDDPQYVIALRKYQEGDV